MYLKRLEIKGFKSFANNTVLEFQPPVDGRFSITAIVGPNGSGKSNVVDAIRWVMGEQSIKSLRGKKSEDVIFSGSENKGALGACEVTMVLDNTGTKNDLDYPEVVITRRLYRSGEGEYLINGNPVRLLDIHLFLAKSQFGQHSYSVVSQGTIDRLLIVSPSERKDFLDEASGIKEFQIKEHQAELKLNRTRENMVQVDRLLVEVEPRLKLLARQVKKLEKRQEVELDLREAQEKYFASLYWTNKNEIDRLEKLLTEVEENYRREFSALEKVQDELAILARSESRQEAFLTLQTKHQEAVKIKNEWERQLVVLSGKMQTVYSQIGKQNISWLEQKKTEIESSYQHSAEEQQRLEIALNRENEQVNSLQQKVAALNDERTRLSVKISQLQTRAWQEQGERSYLEASGLTAVKAVLDNRDRIGKVYGVLAELGEAPQDYWTALEVAAGQHLSSLVVDTDETAKNGIEYLRREKLGVATFLPANKIVGRPLSNEAHNLSNTNGVIGLAIDLVKFDARFKEIFSYVFGDTVVVRDLEAAKRLGIGSWRMVTLEGDLIERRGVMRGGYRQGRKRGLSFSGRASLTAEDRQLNWEKELHAEQEKLQTTEKEWETMRTELMKAETVKQGLQAKAELLTNELKQKEGEKAGLERELSFVNMNPADYEKHLGGLGMEKTLYEKELKKSIAALELVAAEIADFNAQEEQKKQRVFLLQEQMQKTQNSVNQILNERNEYKIQLAKLETRQEDVATEVSNEMSMSIISVSERQKNILSSSDLETAASDIQKLKYQLSLIGGIDEEVTKEYEETKERYDFLSGQLTDLQAATTDLEKMVEELSEIMKKKREASFKKIRKEFDRYFKILFNGGTAVLEEIYGEPEPEEGEEPLLATEEQVEVVPKQKREKVLTGIDIIVNPPGKKIKNLNALSGGERTLTSIALICAILNCNPSPFVVMDEVEAALDEANTLRFANIMAELAHQSQFVVITHNRVTMHAAGALYGVTMGSEGISRVLSVDLKDAPVGDKPNKD